jgi:hypothetical protein
MTREISERKVRIPVRLIDGTWEYEFGGIVPARPSAVGELVLKQSDIVDIEFLANLRSKARFKILDEGAELLVSLNIKETGSLSPEQIALLIPYDKMVGKIAREFFTREWSSGDLRFVQVRLAEPSKKQMRTLATETGGLWLLTEGTKATGLASTMVRLPEELSKKPLVSLNHAYTELSEIYEHWRISHTGNVYSQILYKESDGRWYPLNLLRDEALDKRDAQIASKIWDEFMSKMTRTPPQLGKK